MRDYLTQRILQEGTYIVKNGATVRATAKVFSLGKSTVHKDVVERLYYIDRDLYYKVRQVLNINLSQRHIRGGEATKQKYLKLNDSLTCLTND